MTGWLKVVGLGPGTEDWLTPEARRDLAEATDLIGYFPYVDRVPPGPQVRHASDNRVELDRARHALELAAEGRRVAVVSGGDPGIFAMAAAVFEALDDPAAPAAWHRVPLSVDPGISAMHAAAARAGAPLGHDFCAISLSDNLKPWEVVLKRLRLAAEADFVIALYNPISRARPWQLGAAFDALRDHRSAETPVILAQAVGRPDEALTITTLGAVDAAQADMRTCVIIGASHTRLVPRDGAQPWVYTPRSYAVRG
ncbi:precorrin-3B C(17)-methyltransferase [Azospirillum brasilense]|uniref:precorrin-3B C(17)-methyltransferase n=1 Tax=Azospirillum brasilense TaxID=192 RepID=UPI000E67E76F|nr:precorrin-3B C(17)-methyltransferase [Azospirillum brasilense]NUB29687.1 precorrin-3B C(17)-methyltransferase [Azospirillum brasilense]NUB36301.1 precorrin-3B C(17)-methyltransferase [Azospirillum brasilense]RIW08200.1 precorrin-3B C(17)-methyltransferase [Azospirillum brasilense]